MKAFLVSKQTAFRKTHDLTELQDVTMKLDRSFEVLTQPLNRLYIYAVDIRYPGATADAPEAREAVTAMKAIRRFVRARLGLK